ncbi:alpha/beta hydrolase [Terrimonas alba]|uniref:alpha/beta hydrolase n=1 Tax=Terrimonas alba TaxID=3349636 RepID=UPI0035F221B5
MQLVHTANILVENRTLLSVFLEREVKIDFFLPKNVADPSAMSLLLINDGQNMDELGLQAILERLYADKLINPVLIAAIHTGSQRKMEYGIASQADYLGRGARAGAYTYFILRELLPFIRDSYQITSFKERAFAGFSLGALMAMDIVWNHPEKFSKAGLFSASFWWRSIDQTEKEYDDDKHRIMHQVIRNGKYHRGLKFFFQCGNMDETMDRNNNGVIDSIDDTLDIIKELEAKGYDRERDIEYLEMSDGKHDIATWGRAMPEFLKWGWGKGGRS